MTISIGIPFFNNSATLLGALRSVFAQTYQDWELILVDDGSSDNSLEIARAIRDSRVRVYSDGVNRGLSNRLNQIAHLAQTPYLASMHSDDMMHPERLAKQYRYLEENPRVDLVGTAAYSIDEDGHLVGVRGQMRLDLRPELVLKRGLFLHPTVLGRTDWFRRNPYDPQFDRAEDHELWCRSLAHSTFSKITEPLLFYREGRGNLKNYLVSQRIDRKIFWRYGPATAGKWRTTGLVLESVAKGWIYWLCTRVGFEQYLVSLRNSRIKPEQQTDVMKILQRINHTSVPGVDV